MEYDIFGVPVSFVSVWEATDLTRSSFSPTIFSTRPRSKGDCQDLANLDLTASGAYTVNLSLTVEHAVCFGLFSSDWFGWVWYGSFRFGSSQTGACREPSEPFCVGVLV